MARLVAHRATAAAAARSRCAHRRRRRRSGRKGRLRYPLWDHSFNRGSKENKRPSLSVVPASRASSRWAWVGVGGAQAGLWRPPKRWAGIEAPAPSADGLEARAGKPPAAGGVGTAVVPDAPAAAVVSKGCKQSLYRPRFRLISTTARALLSSLALSTKPTFPQMSMKRG